MGKKSGRKLHAQYYVIFEKLFVSKERNYPEVIYYNTRKIASELLYE